LHRDISPLRGAAPTHPPTMQICTDKLHRDVIKCAKFHLFIPSRYFATAPQRSHGSHLQAKSII